jgi:hypothetical protein
VILDLNRDEAGKLWALLYDLISNSYQGGQRCWPVGLDEPANPEEHLRVLQEVETRLRKEVAK